MEKANTSVDRCWQRSLVPQSNSVGKRPDIQNLLIAEWNFQVVDFPLMLNLNVLLGKTTLWTGHILRPINVRAQNSPVCSIISPQREIKLCMHAYHKMKLLDLAQLFFPEGIQEIKLALVLLHSIEQEI